ncbi:MAG: DUF397 domain-containing protein [Actinomycetota bacterium]|nr:DUF397 domain-containing protein [Actinomycetota bacterium]
MIRNDLSAAVWRKSSRSNGQYGCVEAAFLEHGAIAVRDSKDPTGAVLVFNPGEWTAFVGGVQDRGFNRS